METACFQVASMVLTDWKSVARSNAIVHSEQDNSPLGERNFLAPSSMGVLSDLLVFLELESFVSKDKFGETLDFSHFFHFYLYFLRVFFGRFKKNAYLCSRSVVSTVLQDIVG